MTYLFYFTFLLVVLSHESVVLKNIKTLQGNKLKKRNWEDFSPEEKTIATSSLFLVFFCIAGLFTSQWLLFLVYWSVSFLTTQTLKVTSDKYVTSVYSVSAFLGVVTAFFIIINKYHLRLDILSLLT